VFGELSAGNTLVGYDMLGTLVSTSDLSVRASAHVGDLRVTGNVNIGDASNTASSLTAEGYVDVRGSVIVMRDMIVSEYVSVIGNVTVMRNMTVNGDDGTANMIAVSVIGNVTVRGELAAGNTLVGYNLLGAMVSPNSALNVLGPASVGNLRVTGNVNVGDTSNMMSSLTAEGYVDVGGAVTVMSDMIVSNYVSVIGNVTVMRHMTVNGSGTVGGNSNVAISAGRLDVTRNLTVNTMISGGVLIILNEPGVNATTGRAVSKAGSFEMNGSGEIRLARWHDFSVMTDVHISGALTVTATDPSMTSNIIVGNNVDIGGTFTTVRTNVDVSGNLNAGAVAAGGNVYVLKDAKTVGNFTATGNVTTTGHLEVASLIVSGDVSVGYNRTGNDTGRSSLMASGYVEVLGDVKVTKDLSVSGYDGSGIAVSAAQIFVGETLSLLSTSGPVTVKVTKGGTSGSPVTSEVRLFFSAAATVVHITNPYHIFHILDDLTAEGDFEIRADDDTSSVEMDGNVRIQNRATGERYDFISVPSTTIRGVLFARDVKIGSASPLIVSDLKATRALDVRNLIVTGDVVVEDIRASGYIEVGGTVDVSYNVTVTGSKLVGSDHVAISAGSLLIGGSLWVDNKDGTAFSPLPVIIRLTDPGSSSARVESIVGSLKSTGEVTLDLADWHDLSTSSIDIGGDFEITTGTGPTYLNVTGNTKIDGAFKAGVVEVNIHGVLNAYSFDTGYNVYIGGEAVIVNPLNPAQNFFNARGNVLIEGGLQAGDVTFGNWPATGPAPVEPGKTFEIHGTTAIGNLKATNDVTIGHSGTDVPDGTAHADTVKLTALSVDIRGALRVHGVAEITNDLVVDGVLRIHGALYAKSVTAGDEVTVRGEAIIGVREQGTNKMLTPGAFNAKGDVVIRTTLHAGDVTIGDRAVDIVSKLEVNGNATVGTLDVTGDVDIGINLTALSDVTIGIEDWIDPAALTVGGSVNIYQGSLNYSLTVTGDVTIGGSMIAGDVKVGDGTHMSDLKVGGNVDMVIVDSGGNILKSYDITVTGSVEIGNTLSARHVTVGTDSDVHSIKVLGAANVENLKVFGKGEFKSHLDVNDVEVTKDLTVDGSLNVSGDTVTANKLTVGENMTMTFKTGKITMTLGDDSSVGVIITAESSIEITMPGKTFTAYAFNMLGNVDVKGSLEVISSYRCYGETTISETFDLHNALRPTMLFSAGDTTVGAMKVFDTVMTSFMGKEITLTINGTPGDVSLDVGRSFTLNSGVNLLIENGNLNMGENSSLALRKGYLILEDGDINVNSGKNASILVQEGHMKVNGDINGLEGSAPSYGTGITLEVMKGSTDGGLDVTGNLSVLSLTVGTGLGAVDARVGGDLKVGLGKMYISGDLFMDGEGVSIQLYSDGTVKGQIN
jgi:hypothetical protein